MGRLHERICAAVAEERFVIGAHAANRLDERSISDWQVAVGLKEARMIAERPASRPNAAIEVEQTLSDGRIIRAIWSWLPINKVAKLVTVYDVSEI